MVYSDSLVVLRDRFADWLDEHPYDDDAHRPPQPRAVPSQRDAAPPAGSVASKSITQAEHEDDLDAARRILFGVFLGAMHWGLAGGLVYILMT
jgi:hypothetical protein